MWKSGVYWNGSGNKLNQMNVYGGAESATYTHDVEPHGSVVGNSISSPTVFVGFGLDWRTTIEDFAAENTAMVSKPGPGPTGFLSDGTVGASFKRESTTRMRPMPPPSSRTTCRAVISIIMAQSISTWIPIGASTSAVPKCKTLSITATLTVRRRASISRRLHGLVRPPMRPLRLSRAPVTLTVKVLLKDGNGNYETNGTGLAMDTTHPGTRQRINYLQSTR